MRWLIAFLLLAAVAASSGVILQARAVSEARIETSSVRNENIDKAMQEDLTAGEELERLRGETRDLLKLRNEVRQLRSRSSELTQAMAENARLRQLQQSTAAAPTTNSIPAPVEGFTARDALAEMGLGTPEATMQSFFRAVRDGDVKRFLECVSPDFSDRPPPQYLENPDQVAQFSANLRELGKFKDVRIVDRKDVSPEEVVLGLQSSTKPAVMHMTFRKVGNQWLVERPY